MKKIHVVKYTYIAYKTNISHGVLLTSKIIEIISVWNKVMILHH